MTEQPPLETLVNNLKGILPTADYLKPWLAKLLADPESLVIIAIEKPLSDKPHIGIAWLSTQERLQVRKALTNINKTRETKGQPPTNEIPCH
jgi:hypothetical protein